MKDAAAPAKPPTLSPNALRVLEARYLARDRTTGAIRETPAELFHRVAAAVAAAEATWVPAGDAAACQARWTARFEQLMASLTFLPNSPTLMNAGRELGMLSACFVLPVEDSIEAIFETLKHAALIQKTGGGTGFDFSRIRPTGSVVQTSGGLASGPMAFLEVFSAASHAIQQGAFRRGANMGVLKVTHPDIIDFIQAKDDPRRLTNFNLSVSATDAFMEAVSAAPSSPHLVLDPRTGQSRPLALPGSRGSAWTVGEVFERIVERAWRSGEPGMIFLDRIQRDNMTPALGPIEATNPCGEQPLLPHEACTLGSINVARFATARGFEWSALEAVVRDATRFLDDVVEINRYPIEATREMCRGNRKIGLGIMGFADALFLLGIPYGSSEAIAFARELQQRLNLAAHAASEALAAERGSFPNWAASRWALEHRRPHRNAAVTTIAPTGTISILANCSAGIEPVFSLAFHRHILDGAELLEVNPVFLAAARARGIYSERLLERLLREGTLQGCPEAPADLKRLFVTARDLTADEHLGIQAAFQESCDAGVSKTINFSQAATAADVRATFLRAFRLGLKGVTVYRDRSRESQPMALEAASELKLFCMGCS